MYWVCDKQSTFETPEHKREADLVTQYAEKIGAGYNVALYTVRSPKVTILEIAMSAKSTM